MIKKDIPKIKGDIFLDEALSKHTTFRIGGLCSIWAEPKNEADIKEILRFARLKKKKIFVMGNGSNVLAKEKGFNGIVIHLGNKNFRTVYFSGIRLTSGAGASLSRLINLACRKGLAGIEGLVGIPGTLGGALYMNAGHKGNIADCLEEIKIMDKTTGKTSTIKKKNINFGYRHSISEKYIILEAALKLKRDKKNILLQKKKHLLEIKKNEQPLDKLSAGCVFKNPPNGIAAARYIDMLGLKGKSIRSAQISKKHANFIINTKKASSGDVLALISLMKKRVKAQFGIELIPEIKII